MALTALSDLSELLSLGDAPLLIQTAATEVFRHTLSTFEASPLCVFAILGQFQQRGDLCNEVVEDRGNGEGYNLLVTDLMDLCLEAAAASYLAAKRYVDTDDHKVAVAIIDDFKQACVIISLAWHALFNILTCEMLPVEAAAGVEEMAFAKLSADDLKSMSEQAQVRRHSLERASTLSFECLLFTTEVILSVIAHFSGQYPSVKEDCSLDAQTRVAVLTYLCLSQVVIGDHTVYVNAQNLLSNLSHHEAVFLHQTEVAIKENAFLQSVMSTDGKSRDWFETRPWQLKHQSYYSYKRKGKVSSVEDRGSTSHLTINLNVALAGSMLGSVLSHHSSETPLNNNSKWSMASSLAASQRLLLASKEDGKSDVFSSLALSLAKAEYQFPGKTVQLESLMAHAYINLLEIRDEGPMREEKGAVLSHSALHRIGRGKLASLVNATFPVDLDSRQENTSQQLITQVAFAGMAPISLRLMDRHQSRARCTGLHLLLSCLCRSDSSLLLSASKWLIPPLFTHWQAAPEISDCLPKPGEVDESWEKEGEPDLDERVAGLYLAHLLLCRSMQTLLLATRSSQISKHHMHQCLEVMLHRTSLQASNSMALWSSLGLFQLFYHSLDVTVLTMHLQAIVNNLCSLLNAQWHIPCQHHLLHTLKTIFSRLVVTGRGHYMKTCAPQFFTELSRLVVFYSSGHLDLTESGTETRRALVQEAHHLLLLFSNLISASDDDCLEGFSGGVQALGAVLVTIPREEDNDSLGWAMQADVSVKRQSLREIMPLVYPPS